MYYYKKPLGTGRAWKQKWTSRRGIRRNKKSVSVIATPGQSDMSITSI